MNEKAFIAILAALAVTAIAIFGILHTNDSWLNWASQYDYSTSTETVYDA